MTPEVLENELKHISVLVEKLTKTMEAQIIESNKSHHDFEIKMLELATNTSNHAKLIEFNQKKIESMTNDILLEKNQVHKLTQRVYGHERLVKGIVLSLCVFWATVGGLVLSFLKKVVT